MRLLGIGRQKSTERTSGTRQPRTHEEQSAFGARVFLRTLHRYNDKKAKKGPLERSRAGGETGNPSSPDNTCAQLHNKQYLRFLTPAASAHRAQRRRYRLGSRPPLHPQNSAIRTHSTRCSARLRLHPLPTWLPTARWRRHSRRRVALSSTRRP